MVNYTLCLNNKKIDLGLIGLNDSNRLETIDKFTTNFQNQEELLDFLITKGIKVDKKFDNQLNIQYNYKEFKSLPVAYMSERGYLEFDKDQIQQLELCLVSFIDLPIYNKFMSLINDDKFIENLLKYYKNNYIQYDNSVDLNNYIHDKLSGGVDSSRSVIISIFNNIFLSAARCRINKKNQIKIDYKALRELTLFINKYTESNTKTDNDSFDSYVVYDVENGEYTKVYSKQLSLF